MELLGFSVVILSGLLLLDFLPSVFSLMGGCKESGKKIYWVYI